MRIIIKLIQSAQHIFPNQHRKPVDDSIIITALSCPHKFYLTSNTESLKLIWHKQEEPII